LLGLEFKEINVEAVSRQNQGYIDHNEAPATSGGVRGRIVTPAWTTSGFCTGQLMIMVGNEYFE
jgi:hypothetical protein